LRTWVWLDRITIVAMIAVCLLAIGASAAVGLAVRSGYQVVIMQTSSMTPLIDPGDMVVMRPIPVEQIAVGDVISFDAPLGSDRLVTHRVVRIEESVDGPTFARRGDQAGHDDPWLFNYAGDGWILAWVVPYIGKVLWFIQGTGGRLLAFLGIFTITALLLRPMMAHRPGQAESLMPVVALGGAITPTQEHPDIPVRAARVKPLVVPNRGPRLTNSPMVSKEQ
jgi:signal peptidase